MALVKLGDVAREYKATIKNAAGLPVVGLEHLTPGDLILEKWDSDVVTTFTKGFKKGHMLFGRRRAYLKKAAVAPFDGICSGDITVIEAIPEKINPDLLPFIIQNDLLFSYAVGKSAGSLSPRVKWEQLKDYQFELPEMEKQQELVDILTAALQTRKAYQRQLAATDELVKSQFIEMFGNEENIVPLSDCGRIITGGTPSKKHEEYYSSHDIHFYKPNDCHDQCVTLLDDSEEYISEAARGVADVFPAGTVLVTCIGTIGKIGILKGEGTCNQQINAILPYNDKCISEYIASAIWVKRDDLIQLANATTVTIINKTSFSSFRIPLPKMEQQRQFVEFVQQADKSKFSIQIQINNVKKQEKYYVK